MKRFALLITAASLLAVATFAKEGGNPEQPHRSFVSQKILDHLKLSPEQAAKLAAATKAGQPAPAPRPLPDRSRPGD